MFAFALWDRSQRRLMLARDRLGIKPLHWTMNDGAVVFASEVKSILATGDIAAEIDVESLRDLFTIGFVATPRTLFRGVHRLEPGHFMLYQQGAASTHCYWRIEFPAPGASPKRSEREWEEELLHRLEESVRLHLRSDVEVGAWLSPGVDSSAVVALMQRLSRRRLRAFTLAFEAEECDERAGQQTLSDFPEYGVDSTEVVCRTSDLELFPRAVWHTEDATTAGLEVPRMVLSKVASDSVKVVLTGEGSDEVFGGYQWYRGEKLLHPLSRLPESVRRWLSTRRAVSARWPGGSRLLVTPPQLGLERFIRLMGAPDGGAIIPSLFTGDLFARLSTPSLDGHASQPPSRALQWHHFHQLQYHDLGLRLPDAILHRVDRISMSHSLEVRVPFLDHELVEFCAGIPPSLKLRRMREKHILRRAVRDLLPGEIVNRKKRGLAAPFRRWFRTDLPNFAYDFLSAPRLRDKGYFHPETVGRLLQQHRDGHADAARLLLGVLAVQIWDEVFIKGWRPPARTP
jgi:asparagine synthase (glutamine-hydrolysing)